jgi:hypothetical protein
MSIGILSFRRESRSMLSTRLPSMSIHHD